MPNYFNLLGPYVKEQHLPMATYRGANYKWYFIRHDGQLHHKPFDTLDEAQAHGLTIAEILT